MRFACNPSRSRNGRRHVMSVLVNQVFLQVRFNLSRRFIHRNTVNVYDDFRLQRFFVRHVNPWKVSILASLRLPVSATSVPFFTGIGRSPEVYFHEVICLRPCKQSTALVRRNKRRDYDDTVFFKHGAEVSGSANVLIDVIRCETGLGEERTHASAVNSSYFQFSFTETFIEAVRDFSLSR